MRELTFKRLTDKLVRSYPTLSIDILPIGKVIADTMVVSDQKHIVLILNNASEVLDRKGNSLVSNDNTVVYHLERFLNRNGWNADVMISTKQLVLTQTV